MNSSCKALVTIVTLAGVTLAHADGYHYNNILIGDRAAGLGGAYTAVSDDPAGLYYNPAGVVFTTGSNVNGSMNALHRTLTRYKSVLGGRDWTRESNTFTPNFVGLTQPFAGGMLGFSYAVTDAILEDQDEDFTGLTIGGLDVNRYVINSNIQDITYNVGPSFAYKLGEDFSVGVTLYAFYRHREQSFNEQIYYANANMLWNNFYLEGTEFGIKPIVGVMWTPIDKLSIGISARKTQLIYASVRTQSTFKADSVSIIPEPTMSSSKERRELPWQINTGLAYFPNDRWLITGEVDYFSAVENLRWIANFALGAEYYLSSKWALRTGVYSNASNTVAVKEGGSGQAEHVDLYGLSLSLTHFTRNNAVTGGLSSSFGTGKAQVLSGSTATQDVETTTITVFLSATYTY